ncbi:MAG TPA: hypothetical protein VFU82_04475 [Gammaproteobacteria bacterium]|nr:hypothetical protein [Gammaproteobacteria bacterium]
MLSPENPHRKTIALITNDAYTNAPNILQLLGAMPKSKRLREAHLRVIEYAIKGFRIALALKDYNALSTLELNTLIQACENMINTVHQTALLTQVTFPSEKAHEPKIALLKMHENALREEINNAQKKLTKKMDDFNPLHLNDLPSKLQSGINKITQEPDASKQATQVNDLLSKIHAFLTENNIQPKPEHAPLFKEALDLMRTSLHKIVRKLSPHPLSKLMKSYASIEYDISKLTMAHTSTENADSQQTQEQPVIATENLTQAASSTPEETSQEASSEKMAPPQLQTGDEARRSKLIGIIEKFKGHCITIEKNDNIAQLEDRLNQHMLSLEQNSKNVANALHGLNLYKTYLNQYHPEKTISAYARQLCQNFSEFRYGEKCLKKLMRENTAHTLFGNPKPHKHQAAFKQHLRDQSPIRKKTR